MKQFVFDEENVYIGYIKGTTLLHTITMHYNYMACSLIETGVHARTKYHLTYSYIIVCLCYASLRGICLTLASFWYQLSSLTVYSGNQVYQECVKFLAWKIVDVAVYKQMKIGLCCFSSWRNMLQTNYVTCYGLLLHIQSGSLNHKVKPLELKQKCLGIIRSVK